MLTWSTNVIGAGHLLAALRQLDHPFVAVIITTDKVHDNREWGCGYREEDPLGGHYPYSSKGAAALAIASWLSSSLRVQERCHPSHQCPGLRIASVLSGSVIGGSDWAETRIVPEAIRALMAGGSIDVRSPAFTRP